MGIISDLFGTGETGGDRKFSAPVHGTTDDGRPVTFSTSKSGETLISDGHKGPEFYEDSQGNKGHDHFDHRGNPGKGGDRGQSS